MSDEEIVGEPGICNDCGDPYSVATGHEPIPENLCHACQIKALQEELKAANLQVSELQKKLAKEEADHEKTMTERDAWEESLTQLADDAGCEEEWSNLHDHGACITNLWDAKVQESSRENGKLRALLDKEGMARAGFQGELMAVNRLNGELHNTLRDIVDIGEISAEEKLPTGKPSGYSDSMRVHDCLWLAKNALAEKR